METEKEKIIDWAKQTFMKLTDAEIDEFATELAQMLAEVDAMEKVNTDNVQEDVSVLEQSNAFRKDEVMEFKDTKLLLQNSPEVEDNMYKIPKVL